MDFGGAAGGALEALTALNFVGSILLAIAIWRAGLNPKWSGIPLAIAPFLPAFPIALPTELLGCILMALAGGLIAWGATSSPSTVARAVPA